MDARNRRGNHTEVAGAPSAGGAGQASAPQSGAVPGRRVRPRMSLEDRAKIFVPFDPLDGFREALCEKEREVEQAQDQ